MTDKTDKQARNRKQLLGMFTIALVTLGASYTLFYMAREGGVWATTNKGSFVTPPVAVADLELKTPAGDMLSEGGTWWLWVVAPAGCGSDCENAVHQLRQLQVLLNKDADRVQRGLLSRQGSNPPAVLERYPRVVHLQGRLMELDEGIYIVDPIGNLVLFYPMEDAGKPVLDDLKKLLKLSQIG